LMNHMWNQKDALVAFLTQLLDQHDPIVHNVRLWQIKEGPWPFTHVPYPYKHSLKRAIRGWVNHNNTEINKVSKYPAKIMEKFMAQTYDPKQAITVTKDRSGRLG